VNLNPPAPVISTVDIWYALQVAVDFGDGRGPMLLLSAPTHSRAQAPEARVRGRMDAEARVAAFIADRLARGYRLAGEG
jgi:hypothetical protein